MAPDARRHPVLLSDREVLVLERAVRAYAAVMRIQGATDAPREEADLNARVGSLIQEHRHCACLSNPKGGT
jgi:hypothetical protein